MFVDRALAVAFVTIVGACASNARAPAPIPATTQPPVAKAPDAWGGGAPTGGPSWFVGDLHALATTNTAFRRVLFTGAHSQLVAMSLDVGEDIGSEIHPRVEQLFVFVDGAATVVLDGSSFAAKAGDVFIVRPGVRHDVVNDGLTTLKLLTIYSPPSHLPNRVHATKAAAEADTEDKAYGDEVE